MPDFLINVRTRFTSEGLEQVQAQARQALAQIQASARTQLAQLASGTGPASRLNQQQRVQSASQLRVSAEQEIERVRQTESAAAARTLSGADLQTAEREIARKAQRARADLNRLFDTVLGETNKLSRAVAKYPALMPSAAEARTLAGGGAETAGQRALREATAADRSETQATRELEKAERELARQAARKAREFAQSPEGRQQRRLEQQQARTQVETWAASDPEMQRLRQAETVARAQARATTAEAAAADQEGIAAEQRLTRAKAIRAAQLEQFRASDRAFLEANAADAAARREQAIRQKGAQLGTSNWFDGDLGQVEAENAMRERIAADRAAAASARLRVNQETLVSRQALAASTERRIAEARLNAELHKRARAEVQAAIAAREGTFAQRLQARFQAGGSARLPTEFQTGGAFLGSRALTTVGFGASAALFYGAISGIGNMIKEAEELDRILGQIESQLNAVDDAGSLPAAREGILDIARATGQQADEVANVFFQFRGAFGDTAEALEQTDQAMQVVVTTGLELREVLDSLTAVARTFGVDISEIGDIALYLQERFGVLARETITFVADLAPVAKEIGLSMEDLAALGAVAQQVSGKSGTALAEGFGRILPQLQGLRSEIMEIYSLPQLRPFADEIIQAFATGDTGAVFQRLVRDYDSLSNAQQNFVIEMLGGRREAQVLIPVLQNASKLTREWDSRLGDLADGKTEQYFERLQSTVQVTRARFGEFLAQMGEGLFRAGVADSIIGVVQALQAALTPVQALISGMAGLNEATDGMLGRFTLMALAVRVLMPLFSGTITVLRAKAITTHAEAVATLESARANQTQASAQTQVAASSSAAATATRAAAAADTAEAATSQTAALANASQINANLQRQFGGGGAIGNFFLPGAATRIGAPFGGALAARFPGVAGFAKSFIPILVATEAMAAWGELQAAELQAAQEIRDQVTEMVNEFGRNGAAQRLEAIAAQPTEARGVGTTGLAGAFNDLVTILPGDFFGNDSYSQEVARQEEAMRQAVILRSERTARALEDALNLYLETEDRIFRRGDGGLFQTLADANRARTESIIGRLQQVDLTAINDVISNNPTMNAGIAEAFGLRTTPLGADGQLVEELTAEHITPEALAALITKAQEEGDRGALEVLRLINDFIVNDETLMASLNKQQRRQVRKQQLEELGKGGVALQTLEQVEQQYQAGAVNVGVYLDEVVQERNRLLDFIETVRATGEPVDTDDLVALGEINQKLTEILSGAQTARIEQIARLREIVGAGPGGGTGTQDRLIDQQLRAIQTLITDERILPETRFEQIGPMLDLLREKLDRELEQIEDPLLRAQRSERGIRIPQALRRLMAGEALAANPRLLQQLNQFAELAGLSVDAALTTLTNGIVRGTLQAGDSINQALALSIRKQMAQIQAILPALNAGGSAMQVVEANVALAQLVAQLAVVESGRDIELPDTRIPGRLRGGEDTGAADEIDNYAQRLAEAQLAVQRALANGDPVRLAQLAQDAAALQMMYAEDDAERAAAEAAMIEANNQLTDANVDITMARLELYAATVSDDPVAAAGAAIAIANAQIASAKGVAGQLRGQAALIGAYQQAEQAQEEIQQAYLEAAAAAAGADPVAQAQAQIALAELALSQADGTADRVRAQIRLNEAHEQFAEAQRAVTDSYYQSMITYFETIGDSVSAAEVALGQARAALANLDPQAGQVAQNEAQDAVRVAQAALRDAKFTDRMGDIDFLLEMERITTGQAIRMLQRMLEIPSNTEEMTREIERKIQSLRDELSQDFQFNLPSDLDLPTVYETRRLNQTERGAGYQDNRRIVVNFTANNTADGERIAKQIIDGFSAPPRSGTAPRKY